MYLVGAPHPRKADAQRLQDLLQDLGIRNQALPIADQLLQLCGNKTVRRHPTRIRRFARHRRRVFAVDRAAAERAKEIVMGRRKMSARDALHLAVMERHGIERILSFDSGFDGFPGISRLS